MRDYLLTTIQMNNYIFYSKSSLISKYGPHWVIQEKVLNLSILGIQILSSLNNLLWISQSLQGTYTVFQI